MIDLFEKCYKPGIADDAKARGIYPYFHALESKQDVTVIMEGKRRIHAGLEQLFGADDERKCHPRGCGSL